MNWQKIILNAVVGSSLILMFCCSGSKQVVLQEETKEVNYIPYYLKIYEADSLYLTGNYERSFEVLDSLFKEYEPINTNYIEVQTYLKGAEITDSQIDPKYFEMLFTNFGYGLSNLKYDSILKRIAVKFKYDSIKLKELENKYLEKINFGLRNRIKEMILNDKLYRDRFLKTNDEIDRIRFSKIDSANERELIQIFETVGYPNYENCCGVYLDMKEREPSDINILLLHTKDSMRISYFIPKIWSYVLNGKCLPRTYAVIVDQYHIYNDDKQIFGTYRNSPLQNDIPETNHLRKSIGLPSLSYDSWRSDKINNNH